MRDFEQVVGFQGLVEENFYEELLRRYKLEKTYIKEVYDSESSPEESLLKAKRLNKEIRRSYSNFVPEVITEIDKWIYLP